MFSIDPSLHTHIPGTRLDQQGPRDHGRLCVHGRVEWPLLALPCSSSPSTPSSAAPVFCHARVRREAACRPRPAHTPTSPTRTRTRPHARSAPFADANRTERTNRRRRRRRRRTRARPTPACHVLPPGSVVLYIYCVRCAHPSTQILRRSSASHGRTRRVHRGILGLITTWN